jgi:ABC-2 type transport system permease protein
MRSRTVFALALRYLFLYTRSPIRGVELVFWPMVDLLVWGFVSLWLVQESSAGQGIGLVGYLLGGMILWDVIFRAQQGVAVSFLEDVWTRNLLNIFVAPVKMSEYVSATCLVGLCRIAVTVSLLAVFAGIFYGFQIMELRLSFLPFFGCLLLFGWSLGMISTALILRWGQAAESLAWAVPFMIQPFVCVFYPLASLPGWLQPFAQAFPATHVFEGMRAVLDGEGFPFGHLMWAMGLSLLFMLLAARTLLYTLRVARERGLLTKIATH